MRLALRLVGCWCVMRFNPWSEPTIDRGAAYLEAVDAVRVALVRQYWRSLGHSALIDQRLPELPDDAA